MAWRTAVAGFLDAVTGVSGIILWPTNKKKPDLRLAVVNGKMTVTRYEIVKSIVDAKPVQLFLTVSGGILELDPTATKGITMVGLNRKGWKGASDVWDINADAAQGAGAPKRSWRMLAQFGAILALLICSLIAMLRLAFVGCTALFRSVPDRGLSILAMVVIAFIELVLLGKHGPIAFACWIAIQAATAVIAETEAAVVSLAWQAGLGLLVLVVVWSIARYLESTPGHLSNGALCFAAAHGDTAKIAQYANRPELIDVQTWKGKISTAMHVAALSGRANAVRALWILGADPNIASPDGTTPLHLAVGPGCEPAVRALLAIGANPDARMTDGVTPLIFAAVAGHETIVRTLLENGANPDAPDNMGDTPLLMAANGGRESTVRTLLTKGANPNNASPGGVTPLCAAAAAGHERIVRLLLQNDANRIMARDEAINMARANGHNAIVAMLAKA